MNIHVKEYGAPMGDIKTFNHINTVHMNSNVIWMEDYKGGPLFIVYRIKEITVINSFLFF